MSSSTPPKIHVLDELRLVVQLAWPIALAQLALVLMQLVDTAVLGRVSLDDLAGASLARSISFAVTMPAMGLVTALEPICSQAVGAGEPDEAWAASKTTLGAVFLFWVPTTLVTIGCTYVLPSIGISAPVVAAARIFLWGQAPSVLFFLVFVAQKTFLQAHGRTGPGLLAAIVANVFNAVACNVLVRGDEGLEMLGLSPIGLHGFGALGAGVATSLASLLLALVVVAAARRHVPPRALAPYPLRRVVRLGLPIGAQLLAEVGVFAVAAVASGHFGPVAASAHQVALGLASFTFMSALGISGAGAMRVGYAVGEGRSPRTTGLLSIGLGVAVMSVGALLFSTVPTYLVSVFTNEPEVVHLGASLLLIASLFQLFDGVQIVATGALRGAGDVRFPFVANVVAHWFIGLPTAIFLAFGLGWGPRGIWWGLTAGLVSVAVALLGRFLVISRRELVRV